MPLPVAHALVGASVVTALRPSSSFTLRRDWRELVLGAFLGILPDFDYLLNLSQGIIGQGWHHGFTHSIAFSLLTGLLLAATVTGTVSARNVLAYGLATLSHPLLDFLFAEVWGVEMLWPFSARRFRAGLSSPVEYESLPYLLDPVWVKQALWPTLSRLLRVSTLEFLTYAPLLALVLALRRWRAGRSGLSA